MKNKMLHFSFLLALIMSSCGSSSSQRSMKPVIRTAIDIPASFEAPPGTTLGDNGCKGPLTDPRDGTAIIMLSAFNEGVGDYIVPTGKYGVSTGELLRINCRTGEVVGIVRR